MKLPALVTYRSAEELRNDGIQFGYRKAGLYTGLLVAMLSLFAATRLAASGADDGLMGALFAVAAVALSVAAYSGKTMDFPHCPRLSIEELEIMQNEMGLRPDIFRQTHDSVLHGTFADHRAIQATGEVLAGIRNQIEGQK